MIHGDGFVSQAPALPASTRVLALLSGKAGHEVQVLAVACALGIEPHLLRVRPRGLFAAFSPWGPVDPRDQLDNSLAPPFPDIAIAAGRKTIPALRYLARASGRCVFTVCLQDPRWGARDADLIWVPEHDSLRGANVMATLTSPHGVGAASLVAARASPDARLARLKQPRAALLLGGPSAHHRFEPRDTTALTSLAAAVLTQGYSLIVVGSRRTPQALLAAISQAVGSLGGGAERAFVWDGDGVNPYTQALAHADAILVTADSANMMGEAAASGAPLHVYEPTGGHPKLRRLLQRLIEHGAARRWAGRLERWEYPPLDATLSIADEVRRRYLAFRRAGP